MFRFTKEGENTHVLSIIYKCKADLPTPQDTLVTAAISIPGCNSIKLKFIKKCGIVDVPHPGFMIDLREGDRIEPIIKDGELVQKFLSGNQRPFNYVTMHSDDSELMIYTTLTSKMVKEMREKTGNDENAFSELVRQIFNMNILKPRLVFDEKLGTVRLDGPFKNGGKLFKDDIRKLQVGMTCKSLKAMYVNMIFPISRNLGRKGAAKKEAVSIIVKKDCSSFTAAGRPGILGGKKSN